MEKTRLIICIILVLVVANEKAMCVQVFDPAYQVDTYISYVPSPGMGGMTFDHEGNLYVAYGNTTYNNGGIDVITPSKDVIQLTTGLNDPRGIVWTGGTSYGEYLYVANPGSRQIKRVSLDGSVSTFCDIASAHPIELDRVGNYCGYLYTGTRSNDHIEKIFPDGQSELFSDFPYAISGGPLCIAFDPGTDYGSLMYVGTGSFSNIDWIGVYSIDINGNPTRFAPDIVGADGIKFDSTGMFGNKLFVLGIEILGGPRNIWRVNPVGEAIKFAGSADSFTFGPDGAMYVHEHSDDIVTISRISLIPEPAIEVTVDIKPQSCPNPLNVKSMGVVPVAILGSPALDVTTIDAGSIFLNGARNVRSGYEDVAGFIADANDCECTMLGPDGYLDLTLKFMTQDIVATLGEVNHDDVLELQLDAVLYDETPVEGADCVVIRGKHKPINKADINKDGVVNILDIAMVADNWLQSSVVED